MKTSVFKTAAGRDKFRTYYQGVLIHFPFEQRYIQTGLGRTFLLAAGQPSNPPVILLHGSCSNSAFWFPEIMALADEFRVYAVDIIGEAGNSEEYRPELDSDAFGQWLQEVLHGLGIGQAAVIGNSLGGWLALKFATVYPQRVAKLILLASAGLAPIRPQFIQAAQARPVDGTVSVDPALLGEPAIPKEVLEFMNLIVESYNPIPELPEFADEPLRKLTMPVLFIAGEDDLIIDAQASAARLSHLLPSAEIVLLPDCGHVITNAGGFILPFLRKS